MRALLKLSDGISAVVSRIGKAAAFLFIPMMLVISYDVAQRKYLEYDPGFSSSELFRTLTSTKLQELEWHLHAVLFLLCLGFAYVRDAHVRIELVRERLGPRTRVWIELAGCLLFLIPYCYVLIRHGWVFAERAFISGESSAATTGLSHRWIIKAFLPFGFLVLLAAGVAVALKCLVYLFGPPELRGPAGTYAGTHHANLPSDVVAGAPDDPHSQSPT
ncbi:MAG TPA: TRAP transporter small permease subunit [Afifellaceae bacterium]|nr:TRAP transporter small permease subunit [Afifellaceae bacterium]